MKNRKPRTRKAPQQKSKATRHYHPFVASWISAGGKLVAVPQPLRFCLQLPFWTIATVAIAVFIVGVLSARVLGGWEKIKTLAAWSLAVCIVLGFGMAIYYHVQDETRGALYPISPDDGRQWYWMRFLIASIGIAGVWAFVRWLLDPVFYPEAAKGYYMGQSLNNQRHVRETLDDIRDRIDN